MLVCLTMCDTRADATRRGSVRGCCPVFDVERRLDFGAVILVSRVHLRARARARNGVFDDCASGTSRCTA